MTRIGIVGAGNIGGNLARAFTRAGFEVTISNSRGPETLAALVEETGATATVAEHAADGADVVVVTIPLKAVPGLSPDLFAGANDGFVVIDTNNYYPRRDGRIDEIEDTGLTESQWVERQLGHTVVKAFNNIYAAHIVSEARPKGDPARIALPIAADDADAKARVAALIGEIGFDTVDTGSLADSWRQQPDTPCYGKDLTAAELRDALAAARPERPAAFTA